MKKKITEKQIWQTWNYEYNRWTRAGFSHSDAVRRADAAAAEKRALIRDDAAGPEGEQQPQE